MSRTAALCLWLLRLSIRKRLALVLGAAIVGLALYGLKFPATSLGGALILPLVLASWLFGLSGGLICFAGLTLALLAGYELTFGSAFWSSALLFPWLIGRLAGLALTLAVGALRLLADALLDARRTIACSEQAYQQERALNQLREQALQNLAHELRTPLTQIDGYLELLEIHRDVLDRATQARFIAYARSGCEELLNIITMTQQSACAPNTPYLFQKRAFGLRHEIQTVLAHGEPRMLQEHPVELAIAETVQVYADARCVRLIVRNLLTNAWKYTPAHTPIVVSAAPMSTTDEPCGRTGMICVRVSDQGPGIAPEDQTYVFERFVRLPQATTSLQPGSGLGLAICKQLVEAMGGAIWIESTGRPGEGSSFCFTLPAGPRVSPGEQMHSEIGGYDETQTTAQEQPRERAISTSRRSG